MKNQRIVIQMNGGLIECISANVLGLEVIIIDPEILDTDAREDTISVGRAEYHAISEPVDIDPDYVDIVFDASASTPSATANSANTPYPRHVR